MQEDKAAGQKRHDDAKPLCLYRSSVGRNVNMGWSRTRDPENPISLQSALDIVRFIGWHECNRNYYYEDRIKNRDDFIIIGVSGNGILEREGEIYHIFPGCIIALSHDIDISYYVDPQASRWEFYWMHIRGANVSNILRHLYRNSVYLMQAQDVSRYVSICEDILTSSLDGYQMSLFNARKINEFLYQLLDEAFSRGLILSEDNEFVKRATQHIEKNYMNSITISDMAGDAYMTNENFIRTFRKYTGYTPYAYLKMYRIMRACELLLNTGLSVKEIAGRVGYKSVSNFIAEFRSIKQMTPKRYRTDIQ